MFLVNPGPAHFVELQVTRPLPLTVLQEAFSACGLQSLLDADRSFERAQPDAPGVVRFLTWTAETLQLRNLGAGTWLRAWPIHAAVRAGLDLQNLSVGIRPVKRDTVYDLRFFVKAKSYPTREKVAEALVETGFLPPEALCLMNGSHIHLPDHAATMHQWYARATWGQGDSAITARDRVMVDEMAVVPAPLAGNLEIDKNGKTTQPGQAT